MVFATIDRVEGGVLIVLTHTEPVRTIHLPLAIFPKLEEGDVVEITIEKDMEIAQELKDKILKIREELNRVEL
ncbi:MAG: DUF3006 domain-containing protein [Methanospirillum sp.]|uniref:DUF3006 family protein n=1 Tax=Methanospirillum sp. TaxID=45200 RepID=UPI0023709E68|nr:DUF3006 family protein [Methanospirillum sp.]MDD1730145.1 DUF3006 domain-containing protein [Methanospirillum sp.]